MLAVRDPMSPQPPCDCDGNMPCPAVSPVITSLAHRPLAALRTGGCIVGGIIKDEGVGCCMAFNLCHVGVCSFLLRCEKFATLTMVPILNPLTRGTYKMYSSAMSSGSSIREVERR